MAYTKILVIHNRLDKCVSYALDEEKTSLSAAIDYALNRDKTEQTYFETAINCDRDTAYADMLATKRRWGKEGRPRKGYHIIQSFAPGEVTPEEAHAAGVEFAQRLLGDRYEVIVATHLNKAHLHSHIVFNSVSFLDGKMYRDQFRDYYGGDGVGIRGTSDAICRERGLSVIEPDPETVRQRKSRPEWSAGQTGGTTIRDTVRRDIDAAIARGYTVKSFWAALRQMGYEIKRGSTVKHTAVRIPGGQRFIRLDSLGDGYAEADIQARLAAVRDGTAPPPSVEPATRERPAPPSPWLTPGRRYHARGNLHRPRKLRGFCALYFKYLYLLGAIHKGLPNRRTAFPMRQDLLQFDRYQRQFLYLHHNRIETAAQLSMQYDALQAAIDALTDRRRNLYSVRRSGHGGEAVLEEITAVTTKLRALRRELKLCVRIEGDIPRVRENIAAQRPDRKRSKAHEKADQSRPQRHPPPGSGLPAGDEREH